MIRNKHSIIIYLGYNSFNEHKRGVENVIDFQSKAHEFDYIYYVHWGSRTFAYKNGKFTCISIKNCWYWPILINLVLFRIKGKNSFIIHSHNPLFSFCSVLKTNIFTVHDGLYYLNKSKKRKISPLFYLIEKLTYFRCSLVHFISKFTKEQSLFGKRKNFVIIPNTSHFENLMRYDTISKRSSNKKNILIVRSIEERARFDLLFDLAEQLQEREFMFTVAGKGPLLDYFSNEILKRKLKNIEMLGYVNDEDLLNLYTNCDMVLVIAEYGEGFGLPIIEGYLFDKPVIASDKCAIPEVIISNAFLFENNVNSIIQKLNQVAEIDTENYREYYNLKYSNSKVLSQLRETYLKSFS